MCAEARIIDLGYLRLLTQPVSKLCGPVAMRLHADRQGLQALEKYPGMERAQTGPGGTQKPINLLADKFLVANDCATNTTALPVDIFCRRQYDDIGTQAERLLQRGSTHGVI